MRSSARSRLGWVGLSGATAMVAAFVGAQAAALEACASDPAAQSGASPEASVAQDAETTLPEGDAGASPHDAAAQGRCPAYTGNDPYCSALHARCAKCSAELPQCEVDNLSQCAQTSASFSGALRQAVASCVSTISCTAASDANDRCLVDSLAQATPTPTQRAVADAFCAKCALDAGVQGCKDRFFLRPRDGGVGLGPGSRVLIVNDTLATKMEQSCIPPLADAGDVCENLFFFCSSQAMAGAFPPSKCRDAGK